MSIRKSRITIAILFLILISSIMSPLPGFADEVNCGTDEAMAALYEERPDSQEEDRQFSRSLEKFQQYKHLKADHAYVIPVVFHVFGTDFKGYSATDDIIKTAITELNKDFKGLNDDYDSVISHFENIRGTLDIEFRLAGKAPSGNSTTGILHYPKKSGFANRGSYTHSEIQKYAWDNYSYMNVYIMLDLYDNNSYNNSGIAWLPDEWMSDNNLARVVYNGRYLWDNDMNHEFQATLTHEFGHWLGLHHTFKNQCNDPGDQVDDTPATYVNDNCDSIERCSGAGIANVSNYMDYSVCRRMFTQGQIDRVKGFLDTHVARESLWREANLIETGTQNGGQSDTLPIASFSSDKTQVTEGEIVTFNDLSTNNPSSWLWTFPGGTPGSSNTQNPAITYQTEGTYPVTLSVTNTYGSDQLKKETYIVVSNAPDGPVSALFSAESTSLKTGQSTTFKDLSSGNPTSWQWYFPGGDPETSNEQNPTITYPIQGAFTVTLTVNNRNTISQERYIRVLSNPGNGTSDSGSGTSSGGGCFIDGIILIN